MKVVDVDVPTATPRLVIEGSINWEKGSLGNNQTIKLSKTSSYYQEERDNVIGAIVKVSNKTNGEVFVFENQNDGTYTIDSFNPIVNNIYILEVEVNGEVYKAEETLMPVVDLSNVYQTKMKYKEDVLEINVDFQDPANEENFYLFSLKESQDLLPTFLELDDEYVNGNLVNLFYEREKDDEINQKEYAVGDMIEVELYGISEQYHNFMILLLDLYNSSGDIFSTTPVELKGNCINVTNSENYAYGYFRLSQVVKTSYTFQ